MNAPESQQEALPAGFLSALRALYADLDRAVELLGPVCELSGRCCKFSEYGHTLFISGVEAEVLLTDAPTAVRPLDQGQTCPWQDARGRCVARDARPLGCRVYFCDPAYQTDGQALSEQYIARLKRLVEEHGLPWHYAPLHRHLEAARDQGRFFSPSLPIQPLEPAGSDTGSMFLA